MGFLDGLLANVIALCWAGNQAEGPFDAARNRGQGGNLLLQIALLMVQQNGGLEGVIDKFREGGLAQQADSRVGTGQNMNISADQLQQVFGSSTISDLVPCLDMPADQAGSQWLIGCRTSSTTYAAGTSAGK